MVKNFLIKLIKLYKKYLSPYLSLYSKCRYTPTCSEYAIEALEKYGAIKGTWISILRILRCNPFFEGGFDPVP
ncbi:MAG: membrane protein insertion efficiency factor YidD [Eubacteriales bacterium]|nr:membrane protein insertion efficiency factor YidD [Eubacteriales bacterium]